MKEVDEDLFVDSIVKKNFGVGWGINQGKLFNSSFLMCSIK